jgi:chitinase
MDQYVDSWHIMTYDFAGSWDATTGHQANIYADDKHPTASKFTAAKAVSDYMAQGIFANKIVLGVPLYGRSFTNAEGLGQSYSGVGQGSFEQGIWSYSDLPRPGSQVFFDDKAVATWSYNPETRELVTYDDARSAKAKANYISEMRLGGAFFWEAAGDKKGQDSLVGAFAEEMGTLDDSPNMLIYPESQYDNIKNGGSS